MVDDTRSAYRQYKDALYLRHLLRNAFICGGFTWWLRRQQNPFEPSKWDRANKAVEKIADAVNDVRHATTRTLRSINWRECVYHRSLRPLRYLRSVTGDPLIPRPWSLKKMRDLPLLAEKRDLKIPANVLTVVVDIDVMFSAIHYHQGWHLVKRSQADALSRFLGRNFELVYWCSEKFPIGQAIIGKWDVPSMGVLHIDDSDMRGGYAYKDLSRLGRDMTKVVHITTKPSEILPGQEANTVVIDRKGNPPLLTQNVLVQPMIDRP